MTQLKVIFTTGAMLAGLLLSNQAVAVPQFGTDLNNQYPGKNLYGGSCTVCHETANDDPNWFSRYGRILENAGADDDMGSLSGIMSNVEIYDYDNDGFTLKQEALAGDSILGITGSFSGGSLIGTPTLSFSPTATRAAAQLYANTVYARSALGETVTALALSNTTAAVNTATTTGYANRGGVIDFTITTGGHPTATLELMFKTGGIHLTNHQVLFVNDAGAVSTIPAITDAVDDGNISVAITDEGPNDLLTVATYQAAAITRSNAALAFIPTTVFDAYANVSPYANISPLALVDAYATIDAYAIVDDYAEVQANATVGSYAYIGQNVLLSAGVTVDPYVDVTSSLASGIASNPAVGTVKGRIAITTAVPVTRPDPGDGTPGATGGTGTGESTGGLHCVTTGLGSQGLIFFALLGAGLLLRRKNQA